MPDVPKIVIERLKAAAPVVEHPDADLLTAFAEQSLPARERELVLKHVAGCSDCRDVIALALPPLEAVPATATLPARSGRLTWPALRWGLVAAGVVIIASLGILQYRRSAAPSIAGYTNLESGIPERRAQSSAPVPPPPAAQPAENSDKKETPVPSFDSVSSMNANVPEQKRPARLATGSATTRPGSNFGGPIGTFANRNQMPHGPKMPAQWQQNSNNLQLQSSNASPAPAPAPQNAEASAATASPTTTVKVTGAAPQLDTLARNQEMPFPPKADTGALLKAKPAEPASVAVVSAGPGQIGGYVVDPTGAAVSNARITVASPGTGVTATAVTDSQGAWLIAGLPTGNYKAQAQAPGFRTTVADLSYDASRPSTYRLMLNVGSVSETVEVAAAQNAQVSEDSAIVGGTIANHEVSQLPLNGRSVTDLTSLSPGVTNSPRWTITSTGALQRSLDQGHTWQTVDVNAGSATASSLELASNQSVSNQPMAKQKSADRKLSKKDVSAPSFRAVAAAGAEVWAGGSGAALYHSLNGGNSWIRVQPSSSGSVLAGDVVSVDFPDAQHVKVTTSSSEVWTTSNAGQTWQKQ
jgi:hypothetical protein